MHWIITTLEQNREIEGGVDSNIWGEGMIPAGKATGLLDLITYITSRCRNIDRGEVVVYADDKTVIREIYKPINKESNATGEAGATIAAIRDKIEKAPIDISINYLNNKPRPDKTFSQQPGAILMKRCDTESKNKRK